MTNSWMNEDGEPIMDGAAWRFEQQLDMDSQAADQDAYYDRWDDEDEDECRPHDGYCVIDDPDDCTDCTNYWLDFHADGLEDAWLDGSYEN